MTTKVSVDPANHHVTVTLAEGPPDDCTTTMEKLTPGSPPRDYWIYGSRVLTVCETDKDS